MSNQIADLALLLYMKKMEEEDEKYVWNRHSLGFKIEQAEHISIVDEERDTALEIVSDLLSHRMITGEEFDALYVSLSLGIADGVELPVFEKEEYNGA